MKNLISGILLVVRFCCVESSASTPSDQLTPVTSPRGEVSSEVPHGGGVVSNVSNPTSPPLAETFSGFCK